jgi:hypothetical protein
MHLQHVTRGLCERRAGFAKGLANPSIYPVIRPFICENRGAKDSNRIHGSSSEFVLLFVLFSQNPCQPEDVVWEQSFW